MSTTPHTSSAGQLDTVTEGVSPSQTDAKQEQVNPSANGTVSADSIPPESKQKTGNQRTISDILLAALDDIDAPLPEED